MDNLKWYKLAQGSIYLYFILNNHFEIVQHSWHLVSFKCVKGRWRQLWWEGLFSALMMCGQPLPGMTFLCQRFQGLGTTSRPLASTFFFGKKWMWFRNVSQSRAIHPGITESQLTVLTAMPRFGDPPSLPPLPLSDKISMSESRNTNKSHCPPLCTWITGFLLHIFGDFISKAVWISLVGEISPIWPGACCASLIPDREGTHVNADSIFNARKDLIVAEKLKPIEG